MITATRKIIEAVRVITNRGDAVWNDILSFPTRDNMFIKRSFKVWKWKDSDYVRACDLCNEAGIKAKLVRRKGRSMRLHVWEPV